MSEALGGDECQPVATALVGAQVADRLAEKTNAFGIRTLQPALAAEQGEQFVLTVAGDPGDADDLAGADLQVDVLERDAERIGIGPGQALQAQEGRATLGLGVFGLKSFGVADHQPGQRQVAALARHAAAGDTPAAQHRGTPAERTNLAQLVADEQHAAALGGQPSEHGEQLLGLLRGEHRGRLVENQQADVLHQAAHDLDALAFADRQAVHPPLRLQRHAVAL